MSMPIERAVPAMIFMAASVSLAFRSGAFISAMERSWSCVILATLVLLGVPDPLGMPAAFFKKVGGGRGLGDERERAVFVDGDLDGDDGADLGGGPLVVALDELHHVDAVAAERGADGRRGGRFARIDLELDDSGDFLCHVSCEYPLRYGV